MTDHAVEALKRKRAELTGETARCQARLEQLAQDVEHIDGALSLFELLPVLWTPR